MPSGLRTLRSATLAALLLPLCVTSLAAQTGRVVGQVVDAQTGRPISGAQVMLEGTQVGALAGVDGRYVIRSAPSGTVSVRALMIGYATKTVTGVTVSRGGTAEVNVALEPAAVQIQGITVSAGQERGSVARALNEQRNAAVVMSAITNEEISRSPDSDAAGAVKRVSGVSVQDGKYVIVRGLGERYTTTSLNGARVPSPEPERKVVPLDLFPSGLLQTVTTSKTFTPDLSGDFSGAHVNIQTRSFPARRQFTFSASTGMNPLVTGKSIPFAPGAGGEWLGRAAGDRRLPGEVARFGNFQSAVPTQNDVNRMVGSFRNAWSARAQDGRPKASFSTSLGGSDPLWGQQVGYLVSGSYSYGEEVKVAQHRAQALPTSGGGTAEIDRFEGTSGGRSVLWGGLANLSTLVGTHSRFELNATYNRTADDEARVESGYSENLGQEFQIQRLRYVERSVFSGQLRGEHELGSAHRLDWSATTSEVRRSEPDRSEFVTQMDSDPSGNPLPPAWFSVSNEGAVRTFGELTESALESTASYTFTFGPSSRQSRLKLGGTARATDRNASNDAFAISATLDRAGRELAPEEIFDGRFASEDSRVFRVTPIAQGGSYSAEDRLAAAYGMLDLALTGNVRVVAGARLERSDVTVNAQSTLGQPVETSPSYTDVLPSLSAAWAVTPEQTLRFSASQTLSRPEYRELAPVQFREVLGGDNVVGNPDLQRSLIRNLDLRWEWYPTPGEAVTVALFAKDFQDPIERIFLGTSGTRIVTFTNAEGAHNYGVELELRKGLGFVSEALETTTFFTNATLMKSEIVINQSLAGTFQTASNRPMVGQSPYVANAGLTYASPDNAVSATVLYNVAGRRIVSAAELPLPNVYEEERHALDFSLRFPLMAGVKGKADFENLLDSPYQMVQGSVMREHYRTGRRFSFGVTWQP
ncbi:MAG: TonB-dependent receptor [Longimicrobiales bacterium]